MSIHSSEHLVGTLTWAANQESILTLPKANWIDFYELRLEGSLTIGTAPGTAVHEDNPMSLVKSVRLRSGGNVFRNLSLAHNYLMDHIQNRSAPEKTATLATVATHPFSCSSFLDMGLRRGDEAGFFPAKHAKNLELVVQWGTYSDLVTPDTTTTEVWAVTPTIKVYAHEFLNDSLKYGKYGVENISMTTQNITALGDIDIEIPRRYNQLLAVFIFPINNSLRSNTFATNVKILTNNIQTHLDKTVASLRGSNKSDFQLETMPTGVIVAIPNPPINTRDPRVSNCIVRVTVGSPTGTANLTVVPVGLISGR